MNKNIIIVALIIIIIAIVGIFVFNSGNTGKMNTQINFLSESTLQNGNQIQIELKDAQGNPIANEVINFTYDANGHQEKYSVLTNDQGQAYLVLANEDVGDHQVTASFGGNAKYNPSTASQTITIKEGQSSSPANNKNSTANSGAYGNSSNSSSSSDDRLYYDYETGNTYDSRGFIIGGQNDGYSLEYIKKHPEKVDDDGNLY